MRACTSKRSGARTRTGTWTVNSRLPCQIGRRRNHSYVARTGLEPAHVLGESQATLPIRPPRRGRGGIRTRDLRLMGPARTTELLHPARTPPGIRTPNLLIKSQQL